jgi:hypothetical protein
MDKKEYNNKIRQLKKLGYDIKSFTQAELDYLIKFDKEYYNRNFEEQALHTEAQKKQIYKDHYTKYKDIAKNEQRTCLNENYVDNSANTADDDFKYNTKNEFMETLAVELIDELGLKQNAEDTKIIINYFRRFVAFYQKMIKRNKKMKMLK